MNDNPILRPVENAEGWTRGGLDVSGRESNPHLLVYTRCSLTVELPSSITEAQRPIPKRTTDKRRDGFHQLPDVAGFAPAHPPKRTYDNPNSTARRNWHSRWESNPHLPDASGRSIAVELREYPTDLRKVFNSDRGRGFAPKATRGRPSAKTDGQVA